MASCETDRKTHCSESSSDTNFSDFSIAATIFWTAASYNNNIDIHINSGIDLVITVGMK